MANPPTNKELFDLEKAFWGAMQKNDGKAAAALTAEKCVLVGAQGASTINPSDLVGMLSAPPYTLERYELDEASAQVRVIDADSAVIAYRAVEELIVDGKPVTLNAYDSSVWQRQNGKWLCVLHTESIAGDPYGRDRH